MNRVVKYYGYYLPLFSSKYTLLKKPLLLILLATFFVKIHTTTETLTTDTFCHFFVNIYTHSLPNSRPTVFTFRRIWIVTLLLKYIKSILDLRRICIQNPNEIWIFIKNLQFWLSLFLFTKNQTECVTLSVTSSGNLDFTKNVGLLSTWIHRTNFCSLKFTSSCFQDSKMDS